MPVSSATRSAAVSTWSWLMMLRRCSVDVDSERSSSSCSAAVSAGVSSTAHTVGRATDSRSGHRGVRHHAAAQQVDRLARGHADALRAGFEPPGVGQLAEQVDDLLGPADEVPGRQVGVPEHRVQRLPRGPPVGRPGEPQVRLPGRASAGAPAPAPPGRPSGAASRPAPRGSARRAAAAARRRRPGATRTRAPRTAAASSAGVSPPRRPRAGTRRPAGRARCRARRARGRSRSPRRRRR